MGGGGGGVGTLKNCLLNGSLRNQKCIFCYILQTPVLLQYDFLSSVEYKINKW